MAVFNNDLDRNGRYRKVYQERIDPEYRWRPEHFIARYRLSVERVRDIAEDFGPYSRTDGSDVGGGLSYFQQVRVTFNFSLKHARLCANFTY